MSVRKGLEIRAFRDLRAEIRCAKITKISLRGNKSKGMILNVTERIRCRCLTSGQLVYGFSFSCCEKVFVYMYKRYIGVLFGTHVGGVKIKKIQRRSFKIPKAELKCLIKK